MYLQILTELYFTKMDIAIGMIWISTNFMVCVLIIT